MYGGVTGKAGDRLPMSISPRRARRGKERQTRVLSPVWGDIRAGWRRRAQPCDFVSIRQAGPWSRWTNRSDNRIGSLTTAVDRESSPAEALTHKWPAEAIGAGHNKLQRAGLKMASMDRHKRNIGGMVGHVNRRAGSPCASPPTLYGFGRSVWSRGIKADMIESS